PALLPLASARFLRSPIPRQPRSPLFPYTTLFRSAAAAAPSPALGPSVVPAATGAGRNASAARSERPRVTGASLPGGNPQRRPPRSEEHTSELQSLTNLVCRLLLEKNKNRHLPLPP